MSPFLLHVFSTFDLGGPQMRAVQLMNAWGPAFRHAIVSVGRGELAARDLLSKSVPVEFPAFPDLKSGNLPARLAAIAKRIRELKPDLVLTYNWGAVEVVMSRRLFGGPPLVHHEDGFSEDETGGQLARRIWFRRLALPAAHRLIVPSKTLERTAVQIWRRPANTVLYIPNGVDLASFDVAPSPAAIPGLGRNDGTLVVGTLAGLRPEKNLTRLVRVFAAAAKNLKAKLVIVGAGPEKEAILAEARTQGITDWVLLPGFLADPHRYVGLFDVFALTSDTEQFPLSLVEAMAARLPAVCSKVGDIPDIVASANAPYIALKEDEATLTESLRTLLTNADLRRRVGTANRERVERDFALSLMIERYERVYRDAMAGASG